MSYRFTCLAKPLGARSIWWLIVAFATLASAIPAQAQSISISSGNKQTGVVGTTLANALVVKVKGRTGGGLPGVAVTFAVSTGGGTASSVTTVTSFNGTASTTLKLGTVVGTNSVTATAANIGSVTFVETALAGAATKLTLTPSSATTQTGVALTYKATLLDTYGNTASASTHAVTFSVSGVSGSFSPVPPVVPTNGIAISSFTPATVGSATVTASATGLVGASAALTVNIGAPAKLALTPSSAATTAGAAVSYMVSIQDAYGNTVTSATNPITFSLTALPGTFNPPSPVAAVNGVATSSLTVTNSGTATVQVSATGLTGASATLSVGAGPATRLALAPVNASTQTGVAVAYTATVRDSYGNTVTTATNGLTFSVNGVSGSFTPNSIEHPLTPSGGSATSTFTATSAGIATISVTSPGLSSASATLGVTLAQATKLSLTPTNASTQTGAAVTYTAAIVDANNNLVPSATNPITFSASGVLGSFVPASPVTPINGIATASFTAANPGTATVSASANALAGATATLAVAAVSTGPPQSLFTTQTPALPNASDGVPYELGMKFRLARAGQITAIRYWKALSDTGTHTGRIWSATGTQLASVTFSGETASGWQQQTLTTPLLVQANTTYVVSVNVASNYPFTADGLATAIVNADISSVADGNNGVFGTPFAFPTNSYRNSNYFRDILFIANTVPTISKVSGDKQSGAGNSTLPNPLVVQIRDGSNNPLPNVPVSFAVTNGGGSVYPTSALTDANGRASTSLTLGPSGLSIVTASAANIGNVTFRGIVPNAIYLENQQPGSTAWQLTNPVTPSAPEIAGYAGATSANKGSALPLMISIAQAGQYKIDVYRLGYYAGAGGRLFGSFGPFNGVSQSPCNVTDQATLLIECKWTTSYTLQIGSAWTSGLYVANLTALASGKQSQIWFVVRDDVSNADLLFQSSFNTFLAYNNYGDAERHSLYEYNSTSGRRAFKVSFDRPFGQVTGDPSSYNKLTRYERNMARWLESQGYDLTYISTVDTHSDPPHLLQHKTFLSVGHDEYWSLEMRNGIEQARDAGVNLGFFSGNSAYWRVRFESSSSGAPNRVMVCYKDPLANDPSAPTYTWRGPENNRPENGLLGVMYVGDNDVNTAYDYVISNAGDPYYANTGLTNGATISGIVGYEWDAIVNNGSSPPGLIALSNSTTVATTTAPYLPVGTSASISNAAHYTAPSGAKVFAAGSIQFAWGLDSDGVYPTQADSRMKQFVINVLADMGAKPLTPDESMTIP